MKGKIENFLEIGPDGRVEDDGRAAGVAFIISAISIIVLVVFLGCL